MSNIQFYHDDLIVKAFLQKNAQDTSSLVSAVSNYFSSKIDKDNISKSLINNLAPGVVFNILSKGLGLTWIGFALSVAMKVFNIDVYDILQKIYDQLKPDIENNTKFTSEKVHEIVKGAFENTSEQSKSAQLRQAKLFKAALYNYELNKNAQVFGKAPISLLTSILSWFFKIALASAGFMVAGDVVNKMLGKPNSLDGTYQEGKTPTAFKEQTTPISTTQTKYPIKSSYVNTQYNQGTPWSVSAHNSPERY